MSNGLDFGTAIGLIKGLGSPDPAVIESAVSDWLDDHPEATTTVQDGSITKAKLDSDLQGTVDDVADLKSEMSDQALKTIPLSATNDFTSGYFCNQNGMAVANTAYSISDHIDISDFAGDRQIRFPVSLISGTGCAIVDISGNVLLYINGNNATNYGYANNYTGYINVTVPDNAHYLIFSIKTSEISTFAKLAVYGMFVNGINDWNNSDSICDSIIAGNNFISPNLWDIGNLDYNGYYAANGTYTSNTTYPSLKFTDVSDYDALSISIGATLQSVLINLVFWDDNHVRISGTSTNKAAANAYNAIVNIPKGTKYFTINSRKAEIIFAFTIKAIKKNSMIKGLMGKKLSILGDSISTFAGYIPAGNETYYTGSNCGVSRVEQTWWKRVIDYFGMSLCVNNSWSGSTISNVRSGSYPNSSGVDRCESLNDETNSPDIIIVYMGTNDFRWDVPLGTYDGSTDLPSTSGTFRDAVALMLKKILTKYPTATTYICTLKQFEHYNDDNVGFPDKNGLGLTTDDYTKAILDMATLFGVPVIDFNKSGLNYFNLSQYCGDYSSSTGKGLHPNAAGMKKLSDRVINDILPDLA